MYRLYKLFFKANNSKIGSKKTDFINKTLMYLKNVNNIVKKILFFRRNCITVSPLLI